VTRHVRVPVNLGCCPDEPRCVWCAPPPRPPDAETLLALVDHYRRERAQPDDTLVVAFYGGGLPEDPLLDAISGMPFTIRVRPDLLSRAQVKDLVARGCIEVELDVATFDDAALRAAGRRYRGALVRQIAQGLTEAGVRVSVVLAPGLPGSSFAIAQQDAREAAELADAVRLHPVLVIEGSKLADRWRAGTYAPLSIADAVTTCRAMMDALEAAGVEVLRVGLQPGPDGYGRALAGPRHSSLRELVEARRVLDRLRGMLDGAPAGAHIEIRCAPPDETRTRGPLNQHVRTLRAEFGFAEVSVVVDHELERGSWEVAVRRQESS
jgi:hypothetical protein